MRLINLFTLLFLSSTLIMASNALTDYVVNDVETSVLAKTRLRYIGDGDTKWLFQSNLTTKTHFPKIHSILDVSPHIEFAHSANHLNETKSLTRLVESYLIIHSKIGDFSFGNRRLNFQQSQFITQSSFNLIQRSFGQVSFISPNKAFQAYGIYSVTEPDQTDINHYDLGSYFFVARLINQKDFILNSYLYLIQDHSSTVFLSPTFTFEDNQTLNINVGYQKQATLTNEDTVQDKLGIYYDIVYSKSPKKHLKWQFGTRFFSGGDASDQFLAPFSSGHAWDGILNRFQSNVISGFDDDFRSFWASYQTSFIKNQTVEISSYIFRNGSMLKDYGAELDLAVQTQIIPNTMFWTYKIGQYISGVHSDQASTLMMWFDFAIHLNPPSK